MQEFFIKNNKGFTLVETLVAISILSLSILATFTAVQSGLQSSTVARDQITAFYLTEEAMEYIKNIRDENALNSLGGTEVNWLHGLSEVASDPCYFGKVCTIDSPLKSASNGSTCSTSFNSCPNIKQDPVTGLFGYTPSWTSTNFKREIQFESISENEARAIISVRWNTGARTESFQISELIFNR